MYDWLNGNGWVIPFTILLILNRMICEFYTQAELFLKRDKMKMIEEEEERKRRGKK